jgi:hypothetical protein
VNFLDDRLPLHFWSKVSPCPMSGCWLWIASLTGPGYGQFSVRRRPQLAHRVAYVAANGSIPEGLELDHLCHTRCCVNPGHLDPVSHRENLKRAAKWSGNATHCAQGHAFTPENTGWRGGHRYCHRCDRRRANARYAARIA